MEYNYCFDPPKIFFEKSTCFVFPVLMKISLPYKLVHQKKLKNEHLIVLSYWTNSSY